MYRKRILLLVVEVSVARRASRRLRRANVCRGDTDSPRSTNLNRVWKYLTSTNRERAPEILSLPATTSKGERDIEPNTFLDLFDISRASYETNLISLRVRIVRYIFFFFLFFQFRNNTFSKRKITRIIKKLIKKYPTLRDISRILRKIFFSTIREQQDCYNLHFL